MPLENMCISPQCGFSSTHHGNSLTHTQQWKKFEKLVKTAGIQFGNKHNTDNAVSNQNIDLLMSNN